MPQYLGFSTINACKPKTSNQIGDPPGVSNSIVWGKKFKLTDTKLVIQNFVNAINIRKGQKVGQPGYGTTLWDFIFEPNSIETRTKIESEIRRVASEDPRLEINSLNSFSSENGILIEVFLAVAPFNEPATLNVFFNQQSNVASII